MTKLTPLLLSSFVGLTACSAAAAGELFLLGLVPYSYAWSPSADGRVVTGEDGAGPWYWTRENWVTRVPDALAYGNGVGGVPMITADGRYMCCSTLQDFGGVMKAEATLYDIDWTLYDPAVGSLGYNCDIERSGAWNMTPNASHICGLVWDIGCAAKGYVWDAATDTMTLLPTSYFFKPTRANDLSHDGRMVGGWNDDYNGYRQGCVWHKNKAGAYVPTLLHSGVTTNKLREVWCVSGDGHWAYGQGKASLDGGAPYRWSVETGYQPITPTPGGGVGAIMWANYDGSMLLASVGGTHIWLQDRGYVSLSQWCSEHGFALTTTWSFNGFGMSEDGLTIVGYAIRGADAAWSPFVIDLHQPPPPCPADLDGNGEVAAPDIAALLSEWDTGGPAADLDGDHVVGPQDLAIMLAAWGPCL